MTYVIDLEDTAPDTGVFLCPNCKAVISPGDKDSFQMRQIDYQSMTPRIINFILLQCSTCHVEIRIKCAR